MKKHIQTQTIIIGLALFSMLFGAGNLVFPFQAGMEAGSKNMFAIAGFLITAVCLPLASLIAIILFDGDYEKFFGRLGMLGGKITIFLCMLIMGPLVGIPRIINLSYTMLTPFLFSAPSQDILPISSFIFSFIFLTITFFATYEEHKSIIILGRYIAPALLTSLLLMIIKGLVHAPTLAYNPTAGNIIFKTNLMRGYETLDLLATIFFCSMILGVLKNRFGHHVGFNPRRLTFAGLKGGFMGIALLSIIYIALSYLGAFYGYGLDLDSDTLLTSISSNIIGKYGGFLLGTTVLLACLSTAIALSTVVGQYVQHKIFKNKIGFGGSVVFVLLMCLPLTTSGLGAVLKLTKGPITYIGYPVIITITLCNLAYKLFGLRSIKTPVVLTFMLALSSYLR